MGPPVHDDDRLFEMLILKTGAGRAFMDNGPMRKKREAFRKAFDGFKPELVACYDDKKIEELMADEAS